MRRKTARNNGNVPGYHRSAIEIVDVRGAGLDYVGKKKEERRERRKRRERRERREKEKRNQIKEQRKKEQVHMALEVCCRTGGQVAKEKALFEGRKVPVCQVRW